LAYVTGNLDNRTLSRLKKVGKKLKLSRHDLSDAANAMREHINPAAVLSRR
jgi:hypothetical protein